MEDPNERQQEVQGSGLVGASSSATAEEAASASSATSATQAAEEALAGGGGKKTWSCKQCSLENEEPAAEAVLTSGGIISCALCLRVRGQCAWSQPAILDRLALWKINK